MSRFLNVKELFHTVRGFIMWALIAKLDCYIYTRYYSFQRVWLSNHQPVWPILHNFLYLFYCWFGVFFFFAVVTNKNDMVCHKKSCNQQLTKVVDPHSTYYTCIFGLPLVYIVEKDNTYGYCGHYSAHVVITLDWLEVLTQLEFLYLFIPDVNKIKWC